MNNTSVLHIQQLNSLLPEISRKTQKIIFLQI